MSRFREQGIEVSLRLCVICRSTHEEAVRAAEAMLPDEEIGKRERAILTKQRFADAASKRWPPRTMSVG